jgi:type IV secretory pathway VirD2 relaxase
MFSMPAGTPPQKVLTAVKNFAREEFGLKHRYAMVLHTDEPHPHVHLVVKAMSADGKRLNIRNRRHLSSGPPRRLDALPPEGGSRRAGAGQWRGPSGAG